MKNVKSSERLVVFIFFSHDMTSEGRRLDNVALKSLNLSIAKRLLQLVHLRFLANSLNLTTYRYCSHLEFRIEMFHEVYFDSLFFSVGKNDMLPDPRNHTMKIFLPFCACESRRKSALHFNYFERDSGTSLRESKFKIIFDYCIVI